MGTSISKGTLMPFAPLLATSIKAASRSLLFSLGVDHVLIDFLANNAIGSATVLLAFLFVAFRIPRRTRLTVGTDPHTTRQ